MDTRLILFGFKSCGKSYYGKKLAERLKSIWIDTDDRICQLYSSRFQEKLTLRAIYQKVGPFFFRSLEEDVISSLKHQDSAIISLGGGSLLSFANRRHLFEFGPLTYLRAQPLTLKQRIFSKSPPPFLSHSHLFESEYAQRCSIFETYAQHCVDIEKGELAVLNFLLDLRHHGK